MLTTGAMTAGVVAVILSGDPCVDDDALDEIWVGGWTSHNVLRVAWPSGASLGDFVTPGSGGVFSPHDYSFGPDRNLYVASYGTSSVKRYHGLTGAYIDNFVAPGNGLINAHTAFFNSDDDLLVASEGGDRVNRYSGVDGSFLGPFVAPGEAGLNAPEIIIEGPGGFLYLSGQQSNQVLKLDPVNGGVIEVFVGDDAGTPEDETGGLSWAHGMAFGADDNLYVASSNNNRVIRYDGTTGVFMDNFVSGGVAFPIGIQFGPDGHLYVASFGTSLLQRFDGTSGAPLGTLANLGAMGLTGPLNIKFFSGPLQPDCNGNGVSDPCDIDQGDSPDVNGNGIPDECDCLADFNGNGGVEIDDFLAVLAAWGPCPACPQDLDGDGVVGIADFLLLLAVWGPC